MNDSRNYFRPDILNRISSLELRSRRVVHGFLSGMHRSRYKGLSVEFASHRQYAPGDDLRHIDWRVFGRVDKPFIKEHEVETNMQVHLALDGSASMAYPEHPDDARMTKWDYAATAAACLAHLLVGQQDAVGLTIFDDRIRDERPPSTRRAFLQDMVRFIESHRPQGPTDPQALFERLAERTRRRGMVVILSDLLMNVENFAAGMKRFHFNHQDVLVLHVLDRDELEFPFENRTQFEGMEEADLEILTDPQSLRKSYLESLKGYLSDVRNICLNNRIDYAPLSTADPLDVVLTRFLAHRKSRMRAGV